MKYQHVNGYKMFGGMSTKQTGKLGNVLKIEVNYCDCGHSDTSSFFLVAVGDKFRDATPEEVSKFNSFEREEWKKFKEIANREGIAAAIQQTAIR